MVRVRVRVSTSTAEPRSVCLVSHVTPHPTIYPLSYYRILSQASGAVRAAAPCPSPNPTPNPNPNQAFGAVRAAAPCVAQAAAVTRWPARPLEP